MRTRIPMWAVLSFFLGLLLPFGRTPAAEVSAGQKPNIVFLLIDDMGWPDLSCYGHKFHETPIIDRLASEGIRFTGFYAATPVCSSTRSTIQTGQYSARTGVTDFIPGHYRPFEKLVVPPIEHQLKDGVQTPGDALKAAGYATGCFGKWHLGPQPEELGYDVTERQLGGDFRKWRGAKPPGPKSIDFLTDATLWFIEQNKDKPFFVTLSHHAVHIPLEANGAAIAKYEKKRKPPEGVNNPVYAAMVEDLDTSVGRIVAKLEELDLSDKTIVVFTSDNGGLRKIYTGVGEVVSTNAPLRDEKGTLYEGGIRVPMIVRWPGVARPGGLCGEPATTADLLPTFCQMASAKLPEQPIDGLSLVPLLKDPAATLDRDAIYFHYPHYHHSRPASAVRAGDWKLIEFLDGGSLELYNLRDDLGETENLAAAKPQLAGRLQQQLAAWRERTGARMPTRNPKYDPQRAHEWWNRRTNTPLDVEAMRKQYETRVLKVATCQFPVSGDVDENAAYIKDFIRKAAENKADIVHFSEAALSGYGRVDVPSFDDYDWDKLRARTREIMSLAKEHRIWVVLGSAHYLCPEEKPTNCLYIISNEGEIVDRYDKSMCTGGDLKVYTPGSHLVTIDLKGVRCGFLICYDSCFPEMYNVYRHQGVEVMFHSFYNARHKSKTILDEIIPAEIRVRASDNLMWVAANNSSAAHSAWPTCIARPDGSLTALERGVPGILYRTFPDEKTTKDFPSWTHNNKAMVLPADEVYHNGTPSNHPRAINRRALP